MGGCVLPAPEESRVWLDCGKRFPGSRQAWGLRRLGPPPQGCHPGGSWAWWGAASLSWTRSCPARLFLHALGSTLWVRPGSKVGVGPGAPRPRSPQPCWPWGSEGCLPPAHCLGPWVGLGRLLSPLLRLGLSRLPAVTDGQRERGGQGGVLLPEARHLQHPHRPGGQACK